MKKWNDELLQLHLKPYIWPSISEVSATADKDNQQ